MPEYRRAYEPGGTFFFAVVSHRRRRFLCDDLARRLLRESLIETRTARPFDILAMVLLPDHLHYLWRLPEDDADFSTRWARAKKAFTERWTAAGGVEGSVTISRRRHRERGVWHRRFREHTIRDDRDFRRHCDHVHYNPVKHGLVSCPHAWPHSTFGDRVRRRAYGGDWLCVCRVPEREPARFDDLDETAME